MATAPLPWKTRVFDALLRRTMKEPTTGPEMVAVREKRQQLLSTRLGRWVFGDDAEGTRVHEITVPHADGSIRLRIHTPTSGAGHRPVVVNYHGGGWCLGSPEQARYVASHVAEQLGAIVVSPTYRLAPEDPYPAATDDAWTTLTWLHDHAAELGGDPSRLVVMGDSAGGNLAAVCALRSRDEGGPALAAQVLIYPGVEAYDRWPSEDAFAEAPVLTSVLMRRFIKLYLGDAYGDEAWQISPIRAASHADLPPALILTAGHDPLRDHGTKYAEALRAAGVPVELRDYPAAIHGFVSLPGIDPAARTAVTDIVDFLRPLL